MKYIYIFFIGICIISLLYLIYILYNKHFGKKNNETETFEDFKHIDIEQNVVSIKDLDEVNLNNYPLINISNITDNFNEEILKTNLLNSSLQNIIIDKISSEINKYKITFNHNNQAFTMKNESIHEPLIYSNYIDTNSYNWQIEVNTYNGNYSNKSIDYHILNIKSYLDLDLCLTEAQNGSYKLMKCDKNNKAQQFIFAYGKLKNVATNNVITLNSSFKICEAKPYFYNYVIAKSNNKLYNLSYDKNSNIIKSKFDTIKVFSLSKYRTGKIVNIDEQLLNSFTETNSITLQSIIQEFLNEKNIKDEMIVKKATTNNYYLITNELINNVAVLKKQCFTSCSPIIGNNNLDLIEDIYVRNINNKNLKVYVLDDDIINAIELASNDVITYKEVVLEEINKFFKLYERHKLLYNDKILIIKENGELFKKKINNVEALNLFKMLYDKNNDYFTLPFKYDINKLYDIIPDYIQNYNPLFNQQSSSTNDENTDNVNVLYNDNNNGILTIKFILYDTNLLGLESENKYKQLILKSDNNNIYLLDVNNKNKYVKSKFYDKQHLELAFYSQILSKDNMLTNQNNEFYVLSEKEIDKLAPVAIPEYYSYKTILANIWTINDNLHFNRRDKLLETDKYVDTYSKVIDINNEKNNENYYLKILTYDMYKSMLLSNKKLEYRDKITNTNLNNNVYNDGIMNINKDYYTLNEFLLQVMDAIQGHIITNAKREKYLKITVLTTENIKVQLLNNKVDNVNILLTDTLFDKLYNDYR